MSLPLSVVIPTRNEAANIAACIESVRDIAQEIIVQDNFSEDDTAHIAGSMSALVFQREFDNFSANKNTAIDRAANEWVLLLDADERVTPSLRKEIAATISSASAADAYRIKRDTYFAGRRVRCWSSSTVIRLFKKHRARYDPTKLVHEELVVEGGNIQTLRHPIEHYTFRSFEQYLPKIHSFTSLAAIEAFQKGKRFRWHSMLVYPPSRFLRTYFFKGGILDGVPGLIIATLSAYTVYLKQAKLWELQNNGGPSPFQKGKAQV